MLKTNRIPKIIIMVCIPTILVFIGLIIWDKQNLHEPYSHDEITNIISPPLDPDTTKSIGVRFNQYYFTPSSQDIAICLKKKMLEVMEFETYGEDTAFVFTHPHDSAMKKFERPIYIVEKRDEAAFCNAVARGDSLLFRQSQKIAWTFYTIE